MDGGGGACEKERAARRRTEEEEEEERKGAGDWRWENEALGTGCRTTPAGAGAGAAAAATFPPTVAGAICGFNANPATDIFSFSWLWSRLLGAFLATVTRVEMAGVDVCLGGKMYLNIGRLLTVVA